MNEIKRETANPFTEMVTETTAQLTAHQIEFSTVSEIDEDSFRTLPPISAKSCCNENSLPEMCVQLCVIEVENGEISVNSSCTEFISIISKCIGDEVNKITQLYNVSGK